MAQSHGKTRGKPTGGRIAGRERAGPTPSRCRPDADVKVEVGVVADEIHARALERIVAAPDIQSRD